MKKSLLYLAAVCLFLSCQKEPDFTGTTPGSGTTTNNDYQPTSANSEWHMKSTSLGDYTYRSLGTDTTINGAKYFKFEHTLNGRQYMHKKDGVYKQYAQLPQTKEWVGFIYLKDAAVGTTWTETIAQAEMHYSIAATGLQKTVNGKQYKNVIHLRYEQYAMGIKTASGDQYFAKGIGVIEAISRIDMLGMLATLDSTYLVSSVIK